MIPPTQDNLKPMMEFARTGYRVSDMELREYDRYGEVKYFSLNLVGIVEDGFITEFWGTQRDITDRKLAEIALQEAEEKYRGLFENALEGIFQSTPEGEIITVSPAMASILGCESPQEALANVPSRTAPRCGFLWTSEPSRQPDRVLNALPLYHSAPMHCQLMPHLLAGATIHIVTVPEPETCFEEIQEKKITTLFAAPTVWIGFLRHQAFDDYDLTSLVKLFYGASIMPVPVLEEMRERLPNANPYNGYGQSEIGPLATVLKPAEHDERPSSAGKPVLNVRTRVVDSEMNDEETGEHGEIVHRSPQLMVGYWDKPEETEEVFEGGWFHSGDLGYVDEERYLYVVDRMKDVINTGGIVVSGREIEDALYGHDSVSEVAVIALPDEKWIEAVGAVMALRDGFEGGEALASELQDFARESFAPFKVPKQAFFVEDLPRNTAGKVLKQELRERFAQAARSEV